VNYPGWESNLNSSFIIDSLNIRFVGNWPFGNCQAVAYDSLRNIAFLGSGGAVYVLDVTDPMNPLTISERLRSRGFVRQLHLDQEKDLLFIRNNYFGIEIWDVSDPQYPENVVNYMDFPSWLYEIVVSDSLLYVADLETGLHIYNIFDIHNPQEIGFWSSEGYPMYGLCLSESTVYINSLKLFLIDVTHPSHPIEIASWDTSGGIFITEVFACSTFAYVGTWDDMYIGTGLRILNVSDLNNIELIGQYDTEWPPYNIQVRDTFAYIAHGTGYKILNVSDPSNPSLTGSSDLHSRFINLSEPYAYIASGDFDPGLRIDDISNPSNPTQVGEFYTQSSTYDLWVSEPYIYVANGYAGLRILEISSPDGPNEISYCDIPHLVGRIFVRDSLAYVSCFEDYEGLRIVDIEDPFNPKVIGHCPISGRARGVFVHDSFAYITDEDIWHGNAGLRIIDISDPCNPYQVGYFSTGAEACDNVWVRDSLAYICANNLRILCVSNPSNIKEVGSCNTQGGARGIFLVDTLAFVIDSGSESGLRIVNIKDPKNPYIIGTCVLPSPAQNVYVSYPYAYTAIKGAGLLVVDISNLSNPYVVGSYDNPGIAYNIDYSGQYIYLADGICGIQIYEFYGAGVEEKEKEVSLQPSFKLLQNPIRGNYINIQLLNWNKRNVDLCLYNLLGQKIKIFNFNNLNDKDKLKLNISDIPSGVYFLRLDGESQKSEKVTIIK
jgi:hypothetical protein